MLSKRFNIKMLVSALVLIMTVWVSAYAALRSGSWSLNPADFRYDMSLYFALADKSLEDLDTYEIGAFVDDECRGVAEKIVLSDTESCLYMRIRSNSAQGANIEFRMRERGSDTYVVLKPENGADLIFKSNDRVGMPSSPFMLARYFNVEATAGDHGSVDFANGLYKEGSEVTLKAVPDEGYRFSEWSDGNTEATRTVTVTDDISLKASFDVNIYKVTFNIDGEEFTVVDVAFGYPITVPEAPAKLGYSFSGWEGVPETMPATDLTFDGSYTINKYKATFKIDGEEVASYELEYDSPVPVPEVEAKEGRVFNGWGEVPATMPAYDIEIFSTYTVLSYNLSFIIDGEPLYSAEVPYGSPIVAPDAPVRDGLEFTGWGDVPATMPASDLTFTGTYVIAFYNVVYKIDGEVVFTAKAKLGEPVPAFEAPAKEGHTFGGWSEIPSVMPAQDVEIVGSYSVNSYGLVFRIGDDVVFEGQIPFGSEIVAPEAPAKEGYSFDGWKDVPATMPAADVTVEGSYSINSYTITFNIDGEVFFTDRLEYGAPIEAPVVPDQEGHSFSGWGDVPATMPAFDLVFGGTFAENFYTVTFRIDGIVLFTDDVEYGAEISVPEAPAKEGHSFNGWGDVPATMPAYNLEFDGSYTVDTYAIVFRIGDEVVYEGILPFGAEITAPEVASKEGHTFSGWGVVPATMPASDLEITGTYEVNSYNVTFMVDGVVFQTASVPYGSELTAPEVPAKEGYSFTGWSNIPATMPAYDMVIDGTYSLNSYSLAFRIGEYVVFEGLIPYGSEITVPEAPAKEGHTFAGWGMVPATMPASDLLIEGSYDVNVYSMTFAIDGETFYTALIPYGSEILAPEAPAKDGYSFSGWTNLPATMPASDLIVSGTYIINSYSLIFRIGDEIVFEGQMPYGSEIAAPEAPVREGHTFTGWSNVPVTMPASDVVVFGFYEVNFYTLTFDIDGVVYSSEQVAYGTEIVAPSDVPDKDGKQFGGWGNVPATMPANDLTISGTYSGSHFTVTFRIDDLVIFTGEQPFGSEIILPEVPEKEGFTFSGWGDVPATVPAYNVEFTGSYIPNVYRLVFAVDGEEIYSKEMAFGEAITVPEAPEKEGHTFVGWGVVPATMPTSDLRFDGTYDVNFYNVVFRIGEEIMSSASVAYGAEIIVPEVPAKEGHTFTGWGHIPTSMPAWDLEFIGGYTVNRFQLTFMIGEDVIYSADVPFGEAIEVPEAPEKEGYTFAGWGVVPATMPACDLVVTGTYDINSYSIVFRIGEEVFHSAQIPYGAEIVAPEAPEREGHSFTGWGDVPAVMPASDLEFTGSYDVNYYSVVFRVDGESVFEAKVAFGAEIEVPVVTDREGYTFSGWGVVPAAMPAQDLEFNGTFDVNYYTVTFKINDNVAYTAQLPYGAEIVAPAAPEQEGCTFSGWSEFPETMPAHDVEVTATLTPNIYRLTVYVNDELYLEEELPFGAEIEIPTPEVEYGYEFKGWDIELPATMPAYDLVVNGKVEKIPGSGVAGLNADDEVSIFSVDGLLLYKDVKVSEINKRLTPGVYIVNGKKMILK